MSACPRVDDAVAYVFSQMSPAEEAAFNAHLETCVSCRLKVAEFRETVDLLPFALPPAAPPPGLKEKVMARCAAEPRSRSRRFPLPVWAAAAAIFALVVGTYALMRVEGLKQQLAEFQRSPLVERSVAMEGTEAAPGSSGRVAVSREGNGTRLALQAQGLPTLGSGQAYQLWLIKDGQRTSGGVFVVDATGKGGVVTWLPGEVSFDACGITREPDAFGKQLRGEMVMESISW